MDVRYKRNRYEQTTICSVCGKRRMNKLFVHRNGMAICQRCWWPDPQLPEPPDTFDDLHVSYERKLKLRYYAYRAWKAADLCCVYQIRLDQVKTDILDKLLAQYHLASFEDYINHYYRKEKCYGTR